MQSRYPVPRRGTHLGCGGVGWVARYRAPTTEALTPLAARTDVADGDHAHLVGLHVAHDGHAPPRDRRARLGGPSPTRLSRARRRHGGPIPAGRGRPAFSSPLRGTDPGVRTVRIRPHGE